MGAPGRSLPEAVGDGVASIAPEAAAADLHARRRLAPLVFGGIQHLLHAGDDFARRDRSRDFIDRFLFFDKTFENRVELIVGRQRVLVGLIRPESKDEDWILVFDYHSVGFVKDDEKDKIDKDALLKGISEGTEEANKARKAKGIAGLHVTGWYEEPHYDSATHNLVWALSAKDDAGGEVVNYNMRILGRDGYMSVTLVDEPAKLAASKPVADRVMQSFSYKTGKKYAEFRSGDKMAQYGLAALIAGGAGAAALKLGLFASLWKVIAKGGKAIVLLIAAGIAGLRRAIQAAMARGRNA
jgi:uncharacterized membrane-anchored protein